MGADDGCGSCDGLSFPIRPPPAACTSISAGTPLAKTEQAQEAAIARLLFFVEKHWNELLKFSRQTNRQLERWAARYGYKDTPKEMMDHAKSYHYGRYTCVNLTNEDTVEIRIFRGTLKYNTLAATIQLTDRLCDGDVPER